MRNMLKSLVRAAAFASAAAIGAAAIAAPEGDASTAAEIRADDVFYGSADAKVTIVEYASLTCPHCASFHAQILPKLKEGPIASGKARVVFRDFPLDGLALRASALARCGGPDLRLPILDLLFESQASWARSGDPIGALVNIGKLAGIKEDAARACMEDRAMFDRIIAEASEGESKHGVRSTPSFVIGDRLYRGGMTAEDMIEVIDEAAK